MRIIKIQAEENGGHDNQTINGNIPVPDGWVIIPDDMELPYSFPFVTFHYRKGVVTDMSPLPIPAPPPPPEPEPDVWDEMADAIRNGVNEVD